MHFNNWKQLSGVMNGMQYITTQCGMEQLVARRAHNPKVVGSSPAPATQSSFKSLWSEKIGGFLRLRGLYEAAQSKSIKS